MDFTKYFATRLRRLVTPQREPIPGTAQEPNSAGGYAWRVGDWDRLDRFLVLGTEGGTYYIGERELTIENAETVVRLVKMDGPRVVRRTVEVSLSGRAAQNDPALFVIAICAGLGDDATRRASLAALPEVARTGTHLFHWLRYVTAFRGWGRGVRRAVAGWYTAKSPRELAYQILKYGSRDGWAHRDALRLAHPTPPTSTHDLLFRFATRGWEAVPEITEATEGPNGGGVEGNGVRLAERGPGRAAGIDREVAGTLAAVRSLGGLGPEEAARVIARGRLVREMVPTDLLRHAVVWEALLERMPLTALIRNLGVMTRVGLVAPQSDAARTVATRISDAEALRAARIHPIALLAALRTYGGGRGIRGGGAWEPAAQVVDALDAAFYLAFENAPRTGARVMLALDVSGSMTAPIHGIPFLSCREASAAMALVTAATEPRHFFTAFAAEAGRGRVWPGFGLRTLEISPRQRLDDVVRRVGSLPFGGTDCALPMREARKRGWEIDAFVVYTDSETWAGDVHPVQALRGYREATGIPAKLVVVGMASNGFTIADPDDPGMLDVVGFDTATPQLIGDFIGSGGVEDVG